MEPHVLCLIKKDFNKLSNQRVLAEAIDLKIGFRSYFEALVINKPIVINYPDSPERKSRHFRKIDFTAPRFISAIEDYIIDNSRSILSLSEQRNITTAIRQIFGKGALELIEDGYLPAKKSSAENHKLPARSAGVFQGLVDYSSGANVVSLEAFRLRKG